MRGRACVACASIKIKCQLGSDTGLQPPCERCVRLSKDCVLSAPKRQKDRVAELEAQVAQLTRLLQAKGITDPNAAAEQLDESEDVPSTNLSSTAANTGGISKKRRLESIASPDIPFDLLSSNLALPSDQSSGETYRFDQIVSIEDQQRVLDKYLTEIVPKFPLVPISGDCSLKALRKERPTLLQAIVYAAGPGLLPLDTQEDVARLLLNELSNAAMAFGEKSLELIQAIQLVIMWYHTPKHHKHVSVYVLIQINSGLAQDIGVGGALANDWSALSLPGNKLDATDCWRAWLICHITSSSMAISIRQESQVQWTEQHQLNLLWLEGSPVSLPTDRWACQFIRAERLCEQIAGLMEFNDPYACHDVSEPAMRSKLQACRNHILNWKISIPQTLRTPIISFWESLATVYMHEPVLHTSTNKQSFAAPYTCERLSITDFPAPVVTEYHITAVYELVSATQNMIEIFTNFDTMTLMAVSALLVTSRACYAMYVLAKLYIAVSMTGNTIGSVLDRRILRLDEYIDRAVESAGRVKAVDQWCGSARILNSATRMKEWLSNYHAHLDTDPGLLDASATWDLSPFEADGVVRGESSAAGPSVFGQKTAEWESLFQMADSGADFGLDILFAEPLPEEMMLNR